MLCLQKGIQITEISKGSEILLCTHHSYWGQKPESLDQTALSWRNGQTSKTKAGLLLLPSHAVLVIDLKAAGKTSLNKKTHSNVQMIKLNCLGVGASKQVQLEDTLKKTVHIFLLYVL